MFSRHSLAITLPTLRALLDYQAAHAPDNDPADLAEQAIRDWLVRQRGTLGYCWKAVLLPDGSRLRISSLQRAYYATVVGDELIYEGQSMSPNQFATACLGTVRNAWEAIFVQIPGERDWKRATRLRHLAEIQASKLGQRG